MASRQDIFRKSALERLSSPEQLDKLITVTSPTSWLALLVIAFLTVVVIAWSIFGTLPHKVGGHGILIRAGGLFDVVALGRGQVAEILIRQGEVVTQGQVVARILQPELNEQLEFARTALSELRQREGQLQDLDQRSLALETSRLEAQDTFLAEKAEALKAQVRTLELDLEGKQRLLEEGLITQQTVLETQQAFLAAQSQAEEARNQLEANRIARIGLRQRDERGELSRQQALLEARRDLENLELRIQQTQFVKSAFEGTVVEAKLEKGAMVESGTPVMTIELPDAPLLGVIYIPARNGKKVQPGMDIRIVPSTVAKEEYGYMIGRVQSVSEFPATPSSMLARLQNPDLVSLFSAEGPPIAVYVELIADADTASGFRWSSGVGPPVRVTSGTLCDGEVVVRTEAPIRLLIPSLRQNLGS